MEINISNNELVSHPIYANYEASRDGTIRHRRRWKSLGIKSNAGYLQISVRINPDKVKCYLAHRFVAEIFLGDIPPGFTVDHRNQNKLDNNVDNLRIVTPAVNSLNKNPNQNKNRTRKPVSAFYDENIEDFPSIYSAAKHFNIHVESVRRAADCIISTTYSKQLSCRVSFAYA